MNNNKGFTIVELILIIGLLAMFTGLFSVNMTRVLKKTNESKESENYTELIAAADAYVAMNRSVVEPLYNGVSEVAIDVSLLIENGLLINEFSINGNPPSDDAKVIVSKNEDGVLVFRVQN